MVDSVQGVVTGDYGKAALAFKIEATQARAGVAAKDFHLGPPPEDRG
jgi:hypothetical protein